MYISFRRYLIVFLMLENQPPAEWPSKGTIKFDNLSLRYSQSDEPVLKNISFQIRDKEKVIDIIKTIWSKMKFNNNFTF